MRILPQRPNLPLGGSYGYCHQCGGFVIALGKHCINNDKHLIDYLSPSERREIVLEGYYDLKDQVAYLFNRSFEPEKKSSKLTR